MTPGNSHGGAPRDGAGALIDGHPGGRRCEAPRERFARTTWVDGVGRVGKGRAHDDRRRRRCRDGRRDIEDVDGCNSSCARLRSGALARSQSHDPARGPVDRLRGQRDRGAIRFERPVIVQVPLESIALVAHRGQRKHAALAHSGRSVDAHLRRYEHAPTLFGHATIAVVGAQADGVSTPLCGGPTDTGRAIAPFEGHSDRALDQSPTDRIIRATWVRRACVVNIRACNLSCGRRRCVDRRADVLGGDQHTREIAHVAPTAPRANRDSSAAIGHGETHALARCLEAPVRVEVPVETITAGARRAQADRAAFGASERPIRLHRDADVDDKVVGRATPVFIEQRHANVEAPRRIRSPDHRAGERIDRQTARNSHRAPRDPIR